MKILFVRVIMFFCLGIGFFANAMKNVVLKKNNEKFQSYINFYKNFNDFNNLTKDQVATLALLRQEDKRIDFLKDSLGNNIRYVLVKKNYYNSDFIANAFGATLRPQPEKKIQKKPEKIKVIIKTDKDAFFIDDLEDKGGLSSLFSSPSNYQW
ncbi:hypothetical protein KAH94_01145 [bacterium]|nr:hypothetical protein [bacterium]